MLIQPAAHLPETQPLPPRPALKEPSPPKPPRRPFQFRMRSLFVGLFLAAGLLQAMRSGLWPVFSLGVPLALFALSLGRADCALKGRWSRAIPALSACAAVPCLFRLIDAQSGCLLLGWALWGLWFAMRFDDVRGWLGQVVPIALAAGCLAQLGVSGETDVREERGAFRLVDSCGGRRGADCLGVGLHWPGPDSAAIARYVDVPPFWHEPAPAWDPFDGGLARRLELLPHDDARRQVVEALADSENLLRMHQTLWLMVLQREGYPRGMNAESWWHKNSEQFECVVNDDLRALIIAQRMQGFDATCSPRESQILATVRGVEHQWSYPDDCEIGCRFGPSRWWPVRYSRFTIKDRWAIAEYFDF